MISILDSWFRTLEWNHDLPILTASKEKKKERLLEPIVTTNYDLSLEYYFGGLSNVVQGRVDPMASLFGQFDPIIGAQIMNLESIRRGDVPQVLKLHGSLNWLTAEDDSSVIGRVSAVEGQDSEIFHRGKFKGRMLLYPFQEKHVSISPYFEHFQAFRSALLDKEIYVSVGFSFRDPPINLALADAMKQNKGSRLILVNRTDKGIDRIKSRLSEYGLPVERILGIRSDFNDPSTAEVVRKAIAPA